MSLDELQKLADTPCSSEIVKTASLFAALTGLRYSDVATITWEEIRGIQGNYYIQYSMVKTDLNEFHLIPDQAYYMLGNPSSGVIFKGLRYCQVNYILPVWLKAAGITKHISFHCFRHTFATLQIIIGTDIVTLSRLLGHQKITTTMIYVQIVDQLKREESHRIRLEIGNDWLKLAKAS